MKRERVEREPLVTNPCQPGQPISLSTYFYITVTFPSLLSSKQKTNAMQKKNWILIGIITAILFAGVFALRSSSAPVTTEKKEEPTCCKKVSPCTIQEPAKSAGEMLPESLSRQFIFMVAPFN